MQNSSALPEPGDLLDEKETAAVLNLNPRTLRNWRVEDQGPKFIKLGKRMVRYRRSDVVAFLADGVNA